MSNRSAFQPEDPPAAALVVPFVILALGCVPFLAYHLLDRHITHAREERDQAARQAEAELSASPYKIGLAVEACERYSPSVYYNPSPRDVMQSLMSLPRFKSLVQKSPSDYLRGLEDGKHIENPNTVCKAGATTLNDWKYGLEAEDARAAAATAEAAAKAQFERDAQAALNPSGVTTTLNPGKVTIPSGGNVPTHDPFSVR